MFDLLRALLLAFLGFLFLGGCVVTLEKDGEMGFRFGTDLALYHNAPDEGSTAKVDVLTNTVDELVETFRGPKDEEQQPPAEPPAE